MKIDAKGLHYQKLNNLIRKAIKRGERQFTLENVNGQRYIGAGVKEGIHIEIFGTPGQDLGAFMKRPHIIVHHNAQDAVGNTMDDGKIVIHGLAGDVVGYGMRGGKIHILGDVGYRVGIHMKAYKDKVPVLIIGGKTGDFLGEYMAGGVIILLGMFSNVPNNPITGIYLGTGMHGGVIYIRGKAKFNLLGRGLSPHPLNKKDYKILGQYLGDYCADFNLNLEKILSERFSKIIPYSYRPYGDIYAY